VAMAEGPALHILACTTAPSTCSSISSASVPPTRHSNHTRPQPLTARPPMTVHAQPAC
jgi:hypothetical protein